MEQAVEAETAWDSPTAPTPCLGAQPEVPRLCPQQMALHPGATGQRAMPHTPAYSGASLALSSAPCPPLQGHKQGAGQGPDLAFK